MAKMPRMTVSIRRDMDARAFEAALDDLETACIEYGRTGDYGKVLDARGQLISVVLHVYSERSDA